ncbi:DUF1552 domain-containing protein [Stratiformator vulcanicus]|uniref:DUF1552 domain-containing protein n=1 Tax=Stratiformator vulcanicus TaxID=2527980 RepID=A0A517R1Z2_9PLAN|nr:DUF1552 domain-containing protein [Stratiformator vulcanicus]QDT37871.1 hypothetical protein Pan189_22540 [Stratiformator vulcanicus]
MSRSKYRISRRTVLRSAGVSLALPWMEMMLPTPARAGVRTGAGGAPQRAVFIYTPNGVNQKHWHPEKSGHDYELPSTLEPLKALREDLLLFSGLDRTMRGGTGVHAQAGCCWLTSSPPSEALDNGFPTNVSLDQLIARQVGRDSLFPSIELSCNDRKDIRETRYFESISWIGPGYAANVEKDPRQVFERLFGNPAGDPSHKSILDVVSQDARRLRTKLGRADRFKLDEYLDSVRSIENRIQAAEKFKERDLEIPIERPKSAPERRGEYIRLMGDMIVLAFQLDLTRVATLVIDPERWDTPRMYHGVFDKPQNHHVLTHTKGDEAKEKLAKIDRFHVEQYAYIVERMKQIPEGDGTLLDNSAVVMGSGMGDGRVHSYRDLPVVVAGKLGGHLKTGFHHQFKGYEPIANLWLSLLQASGVEAPRFADSTGVVKEIMA